MRHLSFLAIILLIAIAASSFGPANTLVVTSPAFTNNGRIPAKYSCQGQAVSPPLQISNVPQGAKSYAIIVQDPDAIPAAAKTRTMTVASATKMSGKKGTKKRVAVKPSTPSKTPPALESGFTHWIIWNIDIDGGTIPEDFRNDFTGTNSQGQVGYAAICPPTGTHHYHFKVYALDVKLNTGKNTDRATLEKLMQGHILAQGELVGIYDKNYR